MIPKRKSGLKISVSAHAERARSARERQADQDCERHAENRHAEWTAPNAEIAAR